MGQFTLNWDNTSLEASDNTVEQNAYYRRKSTGGAWISAGFTPSNPLSVSVNSTVTPELLPNVIYEFKVDSVCEQGGSKSNTGGVIEGIKFECLEPNINATDNSSTISLNVGGTNINKIDFILRKTSDGSIVEEETIEREEDVISTIFIGLDSLTEYYWEFKLYSIINFADAMGDVCGPYNFTTEEEVIITCSAPESLTVNNS